MGLSLSVAAVRVLLEAWTRDRMPDEGLGDFYQRRFGPNPQKHLLTGSKDNPTRKRVEAELASPPDTLQGEDDPWPTSLPVGA